MIAATDTNIAWLLERLLVMKRELESDNIRCQTFVLLTKDHADRILVENIIWRYFSKLYGDLLCKHVGEESNTKHASIFYFAELGVRVALMDIE